jgi:hypothetical protein
MVCPSDTGINVRIVLKTPRKAYHQRLALKSAKARRKRKGAR